MKRGKREEEEEEEEGAGEIKQQKKKRGNSTGLQRLPHAALRPPLNRFGPPCQWLLLRAAGLQRALAGSAVFWGPGAAWLR